MPTTSFPETLARWRTPASIIVAAAAPGDRSCRRCFEVPAIVVRARLDQPTGRSGVAAAGPALLEENFFLRDEAEKSSFVVDDRN